MSEKQTPPSAKGRTMPHGLKALLEFGPLIAFFIANWAGGIFVATVVI
ncbi:MAG TPA: septation protein A, partial [Rhizobiales bacterium]|nr:septation protein A [Hyphomicrobiales bacterium]